MLTLHSGLCSYLALEGSCLQWLVRRKQQTCCIPTIHMSEWQLQMGAFRNAGGVPGMHRHQLTDDTLLSA
jgi:hypothetical protein